MDPNAIMSVWASACHHKFLVGFMPASSPARQCRSLLRPTPMSVPPRIGPTGERLHHEFIGITPEPMLSRLERPYDRMVRLMEVFRRVSIF